MREGSNSSSKELPNITFFFKKKVNNRPNPVPTEICISAGIGRNDRNGPKRPEIWPEVERGVFRYQFAYRYEKFQLFLSERNRINNNVVNAIIFLIDEQCGLKIETALFTNCISYIFFFIPWDPLTFLLIFFLSPFLGFLPSFILAAKMAIKS